MRNMFDGVAEQLSQFISSRNVSAFPLNEGAAPPHFPHQSSLFPSFEAYPSHETLFHPLLHHHHHQLLTTKQDKKDDQNSLLGQRESSITETSDLWSQDEVLALFRIRSTMESWFPDFTWEHVSRKLADLGFKKSAEKCKEKFEEESRNFNSLSYNKNYRIYTELDEIYQGENAHVKLVDEKNQDLEKQNEVERELEAETLVDKTDETSHKLSMENEEQKQEEKIIKKRKRKYKFKKMKCFCETVVNEIKAQQEKLHNKLIEESLKRDEELIAKEDAWKTKELEKLNKGIESIRAKQEAIASDRQTMLVEFLKKFTLENDSSSKDPDFLNKIEDLLKIMKNPSSCSALAPTGDTTLPQHPNFPSILISKFRKIPNSSSETQLSPENPIQPTNVPNEDSSCTQSMSTGNPKMNENLKGKANDDTGKRWPKDEVLALIKLRCSLNNISNSDDKKELESGGGKCPLWERISQGMEKIRYKRSARRCKEKWENINKYFTKTKDKKKKRSVDSRTCPYFHQLSRLYNQGILVAPTSHLPENTSPASPNAPPPQPQSQSITHTS